MGHHTAFGGEPKQWLRRRLRLPKIILNTVSTVFDKNDATLRIIKESDRYNIWIIIGASMPVIKCALS